jgi:SAM-dependent methyltransferase
MKMSRFEKHFINGSDHSRRVAEAAERRLPIVPYGSRLTYLDVGCGNGFTALHLAATYGFDVTGIDVDPEQVRLAQDAAGSRADVRFQVADATRLPFDTATFDIVATNKTTHHISAWRTAVAEMLRVLKPGGFFVYGDLVVPSWVARLGRSLAGGLAGFVVQADLKDFVAQQGMTVVHEVAYVASYEAVWQRPAQ